MKDIIEVYSDAIISVICAVAVITLFVNIRPAPVSLFVKLVFSVLAVSTAFSPLPFRAKRKKSGNED